MATSAQGQTPSRHVAFMRGINVGGKNKLPMRDLVAIFKDVGCTDVKTYIQSGNIVFGAPAPLAKRVGSLVEAEVETRFGIRSPVITRAAKDVNAIVRGVPFTGAAADESHLYVAFLASRPERSAVAALDPDRSPGDAFKLVGREIYLSLPTGAARTKLTNAYFDSKLRTVSTMRNWRTVLRLAAMLGVDGSDS